MPLPSGYIKAENLSFVDLATIDSNHNLIGVRGLDTTTPTLFRTNIPSGGSSGGGGASTALIKPIKTDDDGSDSVSYSEDAFSTFHMSFDINPNTATPWMKWAMSFPDLSDNLIDWVAFQATAYRYLSGSGTDFYSVNSFMDFAEGRAFTQLNGSILNYSSSQPVGPSFPIVFLYNYDFSISSSRDTFISENPDFSGIAISVERNSERILDMSLLCVGDAAFKLLTLGQVGVNFGDSGGSS